MSFLLPCHPVFPRIPLKVFVVWLALFMVYCLLGQTIPLNPHSPSKFLVCRSPIIDLCQEGPALLAAFLSGLRHAIKES